MRDDDNPEVIKNRLESLHLALEKAALKAGRSPEEIKLMAVTKTKPVEMIQEAYDAGQRLFGENRVAQAAEKFARLPRDVDLHLIGHLQGNKMKKALTTFHCIESVDSFDRLRKLSVLAGAFSEITILLQLKTAEEGNKTGFSSEEELLEAAGWLREQGTLKVRGLMTIAPFTDDEKIVRRAFARCKNLQEKLMSLYRDQDYSLLSMGMSSDYEWAIEEGSTLIRVGTAIFGGRF